jgi:dihydroorotase
MNVLIRSARIIDPENNEKGLKDILIQKGKIKEIGKDLQADKETVVFEAKGLSVSPGWFDMKANFRDPGFETKEDLSTGIQAAIAGGFTGVLLMPSTNPPIQSKADIEYLLNRSRGNAVDIFPSGALSLNIEGEDITEMFDMKRAGAVAFTDDRKPVTNSGLLVRALQYSANIGSVIISFANDPTISNHGQVNESVSSTMAGLKGIPSFAEELIVNRDIRICEYTGGKLHFSTITTAAAVDLIRKAKSKGLNISAEVAAHHLFYDDSAVLSYDTNYKVMPPFRSKADIKALKKGIMDGTIDVIVSDHSPEDEESKMVEFDFAAYGIIGMESAFAVANTVLSDTVPVEKIIDCFSIRPRQILNIDVPQIREGVKANLTIFDPSEEWTFSRDDIYSRSFNTPFIGTVFKGRPLAIYNNNQFLDCKTGESIFRKEINNG